MTQQEKEVYTVDQSENTGGIKIIGAGFGRTGTLSLKAALEELGFGPCYHMTEVFRSPKDCLYWEAATRGEVVDWLKLLAGYSATVDWPGCSFYTELMQVYPDAKVVLSVRDPEKWYESVTSTIYQISRRFSHPATPLSTLMGRLFSRGRMDVARMINELIWQKTFAGKFEDKEYAIAVFNQHIEEVKRHVPAEKLLVYNVKEGWQPLCAFLDVDAPTDKPFPHLNDRENFPGNVAKRKNRQRAVRALLGVSVLGVASLYFFLRRRPR